MSLWRASLAPYRESLGTLTPATRLSLAAAAIDSARAQMPIQDETARNWIEAAMQTIHTAVEAGASSVAFPSNLSDAIEELNDEVEEPGVPHLLEAIFAFDDYGSLDGEQLYALLYNCYEALREREDPEPVTDEMQQNNTTCRNTIDYHRQLITNTP